MNKLKNENEALNGFKQYTKMYPFISVSLSP